MATALQLETPYLRESAKRAGRRLYRKQVLPLATVQHPDKGDLDFTRDVLGELVSTFEAGAMDQVAFTLVNADNKHNDDPERFRGEVRSLELTDDGLDAVIEPSKRGEELLAENPRLPVSARIITPDTGPFAGRAVLAHVAGTPDPVARGMRPWETIDASASSEVVDLSDGAWKDSGSQEHGRSMAETQTTEESKPLSPEELAALREFLSEAEKPEEEPEKKGADKPSLLERLRARTKDEGKKGEEEKSDEDAEVEQVIAEILGEETEEEEEAVAASLSEEDRQAIELATQRSERAEAQLAEARFLNERETMIGKGIPPVAIDLAKPLLLSDGEAIELSKDKKTSPREIVRDLLKQMEGTIEFSERGSAHGEDDDGQKLADARKLAEEAAERYV